MSCTSCVLVVAGRVDSADFQDARLLAEELAALHDNIKLQLHSLFDTEWRELVEKKCAELGAEHDASLPLVYYNKKNYVSDFKQWASEVYNVRVRYSQAKLREVARHELRKALLATKRKFCFLDVVTASEDSESTERVLVELYHDLCPKTCENFRALCNGDAGHSYRFSPFHRVVEGGWVQGGDVAGGSGAQSTSGSVNKTFSDETFAVKHERAGVISMANEGKAHTNGSQFFVTFAALPWLDGKRVAFGQVLYGMKTFHAIEQMPRKNERPTRLCQVYECGDFDPKEDSLEPSEYASGREEKE